MARILHKQRDNVKATELWLETTLNSSYQLERMCTWTAVVTIIVELIGACRAEGLTHVLTTRFPNQYRSGKILSYP